MISQPMLKMCLIDALAVTCRRKAYMYWKLPKEDRAKSRASAYYGPNCVCTLMASNVFWVNPTCLVKHWSASEWKNRCNWVILVYQIEHLLHSSIAINELYCPFLVFLRTQWLIAMCIVGWCTSWGRVAAHGMAQRRRDYHDVDTVF